MVRVPPFVCEVFRLYLFIIYTQGKTAKSGRHCVIPESCMWIFGVLAEFGGGSFVFIIITIILIIIISKTAKNNRRCVIETI